MNTIFDTEFSWKLVFLKDSIQNIFFLDCPYHLDLIQESTKQRLGSGSIQHFRSRYIDWQRDVEPHHKGNPAQECDLEQYCNQVKS